MAQASAPSAAGPQLRQLAAGLQRCEGFNELISALRAGESATVDGAWGSSCALLAAALAAQAPGPLVVVCPHQAALDLLDDDLQLFTSAERLRFPAWESDPGERIIHDAIYGERLRTLKQLLASDGKAGGRIVSTSIQSLLQAVPVPGQIADNTRRLQVGGRLDADELLRWLAEHRFHNSSAVELPGEFSIRGGILDIFAPDWDVPVRVELFDDEIESLRRFDVASQRSLESLESIDVTILEPAARQERDHFTSYLPPNSWILLLEPERARDEGYAYLQRQEQPDACHGVPEVMRRLQAFSLTMAAAMSTSAGAHEFRMPVESVERFSGDIQRVRDELESVAAGQQVYLVADTGAEIERLSEVFRPTTLASSGRLHFVLGSLYSGFRLRSENALLISGAELFQRQQLRRPQRHRPGKAIQSFLELRKGDLVVHLAHGIGRYRGMKMLNKEQRVEEHLEIEFHGGTKIYVPASRIDLVQKYVGGTKSRPALARIGGQSWLRQKKAAEAAVVDMAAELLEVQAARAARPGIAFVDDSEWQREFDASFPYQETPDQLQAWQAIRGDMHAARPMDRLLCGDVGFGKTEMAMRAAFKAIDSGYQVAVLVPTTILAEQHYHTFSERMAEFPFDIGKLSRFCSAGEQREVLEKLASGQLDIVVGTHRLASRDVRFHNLGLVIIDEEQRFGVEVKERLKSLRTSVDILTMTATPIPRTLHMSLVGVRDISNLETPPAERIAVETKVHRFDNELIRHAVLRELNRGGQIYFVHNRVQDIEALARRLRQIVPEARIRVGHGQMHESDLEQVMVDFVAHRFDLLLATTIVESGLDIPNANTIFVDEADRYGLADLHQLRGRVGRYKHRAYCYLLVDPRKSVTPNAARRLRAIEEFSDMGAGFAISMRDLEIRGAGNLLGTQQSGHIAAVGYELYCQLLENAVRQLKQMPPRMSVEVDVALPGEAFLPTDYVPDMRLKIDLYRRLASVATFDGLRELQAELEDRFGPLPAPVERLLALSELKLEAAVWQITAIHVEDRYLVFTYANRPRIEQLAKSNGRRLRVVDERSAYVTLSKPLPDPEQILATAKSVLQPSD